MHNRTPKNKHKFHLTKNTTHKSATLLKKNTRVKAIGPKIAD